MLYGIRLNNQYTHLVSCSFLLSTCVVQLKCCYKWCLRLLSLHELYEVIKFLECCRLRRSYARRRRRCEPAWPPGSRRWRRSSTTWRPGLRRRRRRSSRWPTRRKSSSNMSRCVSVLPAISNFSGICSLNSFLVLNYQGLKIAKTETGCSIIDSFFLFEQSYVYGFHIKLGPGSQTYVESGSESSRRNVASKQTKKFLVCYGTVILATLLLLTKFWLSVWIQISAKHIN